MWTCVDQNSHLCGRKQPLALLRDLTFKRYYVNGTRDLSCKHILLMQQRTIAIAR